MTLCSTCPGPEEIPSIPGYTCAVNFGQIQKIAFQRAGWEFDSTSGHVITALADWQALLEATDDTKVVVTPFLNSIGITPGEPVTFGGGDNSTLNGIEEIVGANPTAVVGEGAQFPYDVIAAMQSLNCEKNLTVYLLNDGGKIIAFRIANDNFKGIPIQAYFFGDKSAQGFGTRDNNPFQFKIPYGWSASAVVITPAFNPLTELTA